MLDIPITLGKDGRYRACLRTPCSQCGAVDFEYHLIGREIFVRPPSLADGEWCMVCPQQAYEIIEKEREYESMSRL